MSRKKIELYNFDKYQPTLLSPNIDRIEGNADEMVLSADGFEQSASGDLPGSLTINANGGVWTDTGPSVSCDVSSRAVMTTDTSSTGRETFLTYTKSSFRLAAIQVITRSTPPGRDQSGEVYLMQNINVIHNDTTATMSLVNDVAAPDDHTLDVQYYMNVSGNNINLQISGLQINDTVTCNIRYTILET